MDRLSLTVIIVGFIAMLTCTTLIAYQNVRLGQIQQDSLDVQRETLALISRTHPPTPNGR
jgi:hypothetical protein